MSAALHETRFRAQETDDPALPGDPFVRLRYHYGALLGAEDLQMEQRRHVLRDRLHAALMHGSGVVGGLRVGVRGDDEDQLTVAAGLASDPLGRALWVDRLQCLPIRRLHETEAWRELPPVPVAHEGEPVEPEEAPAGEHGEPATEEDPAARRAWVVIRYQACDTTPIPAISPACSPAEDAFAYGRIRDSFRICLEKEPPADPHELAREWMGFAFAPDGSSSCADLRERLLAWSLQDADDLARLWASPAEDAPVLLAEVDLLRVGLTADTRVTRVTAVRNRVRALLPPAQLTAEQLFGHRLVGPDPCERLRAVSVEEIEPADGEWLRVRVALSGEPLAGSEQGSVLLEVLGAGGWEELEVGPQIVGRSLEIGAPMDEAGPPTTPTHYQVHITGAGPQPLLDRQGRPFAGAWDEPRPPRDRGADFSVVRTWTPGE